MSDIKQFREDIKKISNDAIEDFERNINTIIENKIYSFSDALYKELIQIIKNEVQSDIINNFMQNNNSLTEEMIKAILGRILNLQIDNINQAENFIKKLIPSNKQIIQNLINTIYSNIKQ